MVSAGVIHLTPLILLKIQMKKRNRQRRNKSQTMRRTSTS
jgi:hypothetical protein